MRRLFVAVWPPPEVVATLEQLPRPDEDGVRWVPPERWHVTLRFLGDADPEAVASALDAVHVAAPTAVYGPAVSRLGRAVVCVPVRGLDELAAAVVDATAGLGQPPDPRPFAGHVTLARLHRRGSCRLAGHKLATQHHVAAIDLVASTRSADGAAYRTLHTVALHG